MGHCAISLPWVYTFMRRLQKMTNLVTPSTLPFAKMNKRLLFKAIESVKTSQETKPPTPFYVDFINV